MIKEKSKTNNNLLKRETVFGHLDIENGPVNRYSFI